MKTKKLDFRPFLTIRVIISTFFVFLGAIVLFRLGLWQISRYFERQAFNNQYTSQQAAPILDLNGVELTDLKKFEYRRVTVRGQYDHLHAIVRVNQYHQGVLGFALMTPLILEDGSAVFIDRGWIPADPKTNMPNWELYTTAGLVEVQGILRNPVELVNSSENYDPRIWIDFYPVDLQKHIPYQIATAFIQPNPDGTQNPPIATTLEVEITDGPHLSYAFQWFSFGIILLMGYPFVLRKSGLLNQKKEI
ncbi:MAG TPA: SURF1 family protein [Anaerolineales bacterium]|nr:SURF1 family protein [Anaerolineales bacterium]